MRAGFELYRAFDQDAQHTRDSLAQNGKLKTPVLAVGGEISNTGPLMQDMMNEVAENVTAIRIPATAHWIPEEAPKPLSDAIIHFINESR